MDLVRRSSARPTGLAIVLVEPDRESTIIVDSGANGLLGPDDVPPTYASGVVLAQLGVPAATVGAALTSARVAGARSVLSTSPLVPGSERLVDMADIVACDRVEAMRWTVEAPKLCTAVQLSTSACRATLVGPGRTCHRYPGPLQDLRTPQLSARRWRRPPRGKSRGRCGTRPGRNSGPGSGQTGAWQRCRRSCGVSWP